MARAEEHREGREDGSSRVLSNSGSFRSATSYASFKEGQATSYTSFNASFRSCNSFKSTDGFSRTSFKSVASRGTTGSRGTSYHSAVSRFLGRSVSDGGPPGETSLEGVDNLSFFSFEGGEDGLGSLPSEAQRRLSAGSRGASLGPASDQQQGNKRRDEGPGARVYLGYLLVLIVAALHTASTFVSTLITTTNLDPWLLLLGRALLQLLVSIVLLIFTRRNPLGPKGFRWRLYLVGLLSAALALALNLALTRLPAADACALLGLAPVVTAALALPFAGERLGLLRILTCGLFLAGLLLHTRPPMLFPEALVDATNVTQYNILGLATTFQSPPTSDGTTDVVGLLAGLAVSVLVASVLLLAKQCRAAVSTALLFHWVALGLTLISSVGLVVTQVSPDLPTLLKQLSTSDWLLASLVAVLGSLATLLLLLALAWVAVGRAALVASASILFNYTVQLAIGTGLPAWPGLLGAAMLLLSLLFAGLEALLVHPRRWRWL